MYLRTEAYEMNKKTIAILILLCLFAVGCTRRPPPSPEARPSKTAPSVQITAPAAQVSMLSWVDTHTHASTNIVSIDEVGGSRQDFTYCVSEECLESMIAIMNEVGTSYAILMPPPAPAGTGDWEYESDLADAARQHPDRFFYMGGGSVLNSLIHQAAQAGKVSDGARAEFEEAAKAIAASGAIGFGEMAILHLSASASHAFEEVPADHELFLLLADIAAQNDAPIDIHMDPVLEDMQTPDEFLTMSSQNPATLRGNIEPLETLLVHNTNARFVWAHTADTTGDLSAELLRRLLGEHPNLYLSLRLWFPRGPASGDRDDILDGSGNIQQEWLNLITDYPDRFVFGSDMFWGGEAVPGQTNVASFLVTQLPENIAKLVACQNVAAIYKLGVPCP